MGVKHLNPLTLPNLLTKLSTKPDKDFVDIYLRAGHLRMQLPTGEEQDLVLDRKIEYLTAHTGLIEKGDSILVALSKLSAILNKIKDADKLLQSDGSVPLTGNFDAGQHRITNVADPIDDSDVVNKKYYEENTPKQVTASETELGSIRVGEGLGIEDNGSLFILEDFRPRELINTIVSFNVGDANWPQSGDNTYTNADFTGKQIKVFREGERMTQGDSGLGFDFDSSLGTIRFYPDLYENENIIIEATLAADVDLTGIYSRLAAIEAGGVGGGDLSAIITQLNSFQAAMNARFDALEQIIDQGPLTINGFSNTAPLSELGTTIADVTFNWSVSRSPTSISISPNIGSINSNLRTITSRLNLTATTEYTLTVIAGSKVLTATTRVTFTNRMYYGSSAKTSLNNAEILALASNPLATSRNRNVSIDGNGKYLYIAYPKAWGDPTFMISGMLNNAWTKTEMAITNAYNNTTTYNIYRSNTIQNGSAIAISIS